MLRAATLPLERFLALAHHWPGCGDLGSDIINIKQAPVLFPHEPHLPTELSQVISHRLVSSMLKILISFLTALLL